MKTTPWPHSPAIIVRSEIYPEAGGPRLTVARGGEVYECPLAINAWYEIRLPGSDIRCTWEYDHAVELARRELAPELVIGYGGHDQMGVT